MSSRSFGRPPKRLVRMRSSSVGTAIATPGATSSARRRGQTSSKATRTPSTVGTRSGDQHVDPLVVLEDVAAPSACLLGRPGREEAHGLDGRVERRDVVDVDPEVVVGREHRDPERHEGATADQQRARPARRDRSEELGLVELGSLHPAILAPASRRRYAARTLPYRQSASTRCVISMLVGAPGCGASPRPRVWRTSWITMLSATPGCRSWNVREGLADEDAAHAGARDEGGLRLAAEGLRRAVHEGDEADVLGRETRSTPRGSAGASDPRASVKSVKTFRHSSLSSRFSGAGARPVSTARASQPVSVRGAAAFDAGRRRGGSRRRGRPGPTHGFPSSTSATPFEVRFGSRLARLATVLLSVRCGAYHQQRVTDFQAGC